MNMNDDSRRIEDLEMIKHHTTWPNYPMLPMKRRNKNGGWPAFGLLVHRFGSGLLYFAEDVSMFDQEKLKTLTDHDWKLVTPEALIDSGWLVD